MTFEPLKLYNWTSDHFDLWIQGQHIAIGYHTGQCSDSIAMLLKKKYLLKQFKRIKAKDLRQYLEQFDLERPRTKYGCMSQVLWLACGDLIDNQ